MKIKYYTTILIGASAALTMPANLTAAEITASDGAYQDYFGYRMSQSGNYALVAAYAKNSYTGAAYLYDISKTQADGNYGEIKLTASDGAAHDFFGSSVSQSGNYALVGAYGNNSTGAAYLYDISKTQVDGNYGEIKLTASDGANNDYFGASVSQNGSHTLVGAYGNNSAGAAYLYDMSKTQADGNYGEIKLTASDAANNDNFGFRVSQNGNHALVAATGKNSSAGAVYVYDITKTQTDGNYGEIKLTASDAANDDNFGFSVSQDGNFALIGAHMKNSSTGAAYVYDITKNQADGNYGEIKLTASDAAQYDYFGASVSQSGNYALVGAAAKNSSTGAAYLYDITKTQADGNYGEIKLTASDGANNDSFGYSVSADGDNFIIGAIGNFAGRAYTGTISSMTTLNDGTSKLINGISFKSQQDWVIGDTASGNKVTLSAGDTADVRYGGKAVYIGKSAGSNNNTLIVQGTVLANKIIVGALENSGNQLYIANTADISGVEDIYLNIGSSLFFQDESDLLSALGNTELSILDEGNWTIVNSANYDDLVARKILEVTVNASGMLVQYGNIPEPSVCAAVFGALVLAFAGYRKRTITPEKK